MENKKLPYPPRILFHFPELRSGSPTEKIQRGIKQWMDNPKANHALVSGAMNVYRFKNGELFEVVQKEKKVKLPYLRKLSKLIKVIKGEK